MTEVKFERLSKLVTEINELESRVRKAAQDEFRPALQEVVAVLREHVPQVIGVRWAQWVPGFNDGAPCEFTMGDVEFSFMHKGEEVDFEESYSPVEDGIVTAEQDAILDQLADAISELESASELAFGPDSQITLNIQTGELELEEYDCGY